MEQVVTVILAGGQGARFWPISRMARPKQFLSISESGESLIQATARRVEPLAGPKNLMVITNILHEPLIREHVPTATVISEPFKRNTAAAIGLAALYVRRRDKNAVMVSLPADHAVKDEAKLIKTLRQAVALASEQETLVTIGIEPTGPNTAYGYIRRGAKISDRAFQVARFYEKPNADRAKQYLESGEYYWNSGMFVWRAQVFLDSLQEFMPDLYQGLVQIDQAIGTPAEQATIAAIYQKMESISVDFGILEHARNCSVIAAEPFGWNDVGSWDAWAEHFELDAEGNLLHGDAMVIGSKNCIVHSRNRFTAVLGGTDLIVIDSGDALLICTRDRVQDVRDVVDKLKELGRDKLI